MNFKHHFKLIFRRRRVAFLLGSLLGAVLTSLVLSPAGSDFIEFLGNTLGVWVLSPGLFGMLVGAMLLRVVCIIGNRPELCETFGLFGNSMEWVEVFFIYFFMMLAYGILFVIISELVSKTRKREEGK